MCLQKDFRISTTESLTDFRNRSFLPVKRTRPHRYKLRRMLSSRRVHLLPLNRDLIKEKTLSTSLTYPRWKPSCVLFLMERLRRNSSNCNSYNRVTLARWPHEKWYRKLRQPIYSSVMQTKAAISTSLSIHQGRQKDGDKPTSRAARAKMFSIVNILVYPIL